MTEIVTGATGIGTEGAAGIGIGPDHAAQSAGGAAAAGMLGAGVPMGEAAAMGVTVATRWTTGPAG